MALDESAQNVLNLMAQAGGKQLQDLPIAEARAAFANLALLGGQGADVASVVDADANGVPVIVVTPHGQGPFPVLVWIHGGGWVIGSAAESVSTCRNLATKAGCVVVSVDYRLAPEHKAPAASDDCAVAIEWVLANAESLNGRADRVAVGGDSAGGNLSALMAQRFGQRLCHQALVYPSTDLTRSSPSIDENAEGYLLTKQGMLWFAEQYLGGSGIDPTDARISPRNATDEVVSQCPSATVITAGYDPLRDEGQVYAARLAALGVDTEHRCFDGQIHGFFSMPLAVPEAVEAEDLVAGRLRDSFRGSAA